MMTQKVSQPLWSFFTGFYTDIECQFARAGEGNLNTVVVK